VEEARGFFRRRHFAGALLLAAGVGAYAAIGPKLPRDREVALDFGGAATSITDVELVWVADGSSAEEPAVSIRWHFAQGTAPTELFTKARLADGFWTAAVTVQRGDTNETTRWSSQVNLEGQPFWAGPSLRDAPLVLSVRQAL
jgi:hypothetical protein